MGKVATAWVSEDQFFVFVDDSGRQELWTSRGTVEGTLRVEGDVWEVINSGRTFAQTESFALLSTNDALWRTDGTADGTYELAKGLSSGVSFGSPTEDSTIVSDNVVYFTSIPIADGRPNQELWRSDGTVEGTVRVTELFGLHSSTKYFSQVNGFLYLRTNDGFHGSELWRVPLDPLLGDLDGNGLVGFADFLTLSDNFGRSTDVSYFDGDIDEDGGIDFKDFLELSANFGAKIGPNG